MRDELLQAIAEPRRLEILRLVIDGERSVTELAEHCRVTPAAISQHLKILSDVGLVSVRPEGRQHFYRAHPEGMEQLRSVLLYLVTWTNQSFTAERCEGAHDEVPLLRSR